jgi:hypothetical protein
MTKDEQIKGMANPNRGSVGVQEAHPPQRTWVGLTKEQISEFDTWHDNREEEVGWVNPSEIVAYIEVKLKEENT